jgi:DNA (cytosine-5)-methyltransferase 1
MARIICEVQPRFVFVENSPMLTSRGLGRVLGDLAAMGFDAKWGVLGAADVGANHQRDRIWIVANNVANPRCELWNEGNTTKLDTKEEIGTSGSIFDKSSSTGFGTRHWWKTEPNVGRVANGLASGVDRLKAIGNGQVPLCAATAWRVLSERDD